MITIYINSKTQTLAANCTLQEFIALQNLEGEHIAVALNQRFIPRALFASTLLEHNDSIDVIVPMQGG
jgi:sulfur carrier protein